MMRIQLIVTGDLEKAALGRSLERMLHDAALKVKFDPPRLISGGTSTPLPDPQKTERTPTTVKRLANALVTETTIRRSTSLPDLVVGIDDIELDNFHQPDVVIAWIRRAVREVVAERYPLPQHAALALQALRARCSFHLLVPLAEAYFFGDRGALTRAGVDAKTPVRLVGADVEDFETNDPSFLPQAQQKNVMQAGLGRTWWREERHPKRYLAFLVGCSGSIYKETQGGARALEELDWRTVGAAPGTIPFVRALFEDLSNAVDIANPLGTGACSPLTYPARTVRRETLTLRNL